MRSCILFCLLSQIAWPDDGGRLLRIDHYIRVRSAVPALEGQTTQIYLREVVRAATVLRGNPPSDRVALFIHGAGTPAEVAFDVPHAGYSWMEYLADAGFDVFSVDMTGYGRSTRPGPMNDPCNLSSEQQKQYVPAVIPAPCPPSWPRAMTTLQSDWHDIGAAVDYVRKLRGADRISLLGWSLGGPRAAGYAAQHAEKVRSIVLLAPAYSRTARPASAQPQAAFNTQSRNEFDANWDRQLGCSDQYEFSVRDAVWDAMLESDPVGNTWGAGVRRAPFTAMSGWSPDVVAKIGTPMLLVAGIHDRQVVPARVRELYEDLGSTHKVLIDLGCSSHNALWEKNRLLLFAASREWLTRGTVNGAGEGTVRLGY